MSGKVDAVRLPKQLYFAHRVMQNVQPDMHILGHWSYPQMQPAASGRPAEKTVKTVCVVANTEQAELLLNGKFLVRRRFRNPVISSPFLELSSRRVRWKQSAEMLGET